jgi:chromosome segregation ATPase
MNGNGVHEIIPIDKPNPLMKNFTPDMLVDPKTVKVLAQNFGLSNFIRKHDVHQRELMHADFDPILVHDSTFVETMTTIKTKHSEAWATVIGKRQAIADHLAAAIADSDELLDQLSRVIEQLDIAEHKCAIAEAKYSAAEARRQELEEQMQILLCELQRARLRIIELARERDDLAIKVEVAEGQLRYRDDQVLQLQREVAKLRAGMVTLIKEHAEAIEDARAARHAETEAKMEAAKWRAERDGLSQENKKLQDNIDVFSKKVDELTAECTRFSLELNVKTKLLVEAEKECQRLRQTVEELEKIITLLRDERTKFKQVLAQSMQEREEAKRREEDAVNARNVAEDDREKARRGEREYRKLYAEALLERDALRAEVQNEKEKMGSLTLERDHARHRASAACHFAQESIEWGQALNLLNHQLLKEWEAMRHDKIEALEARLIEERQRCLAHGKSKHAGETIHNLETELAALREGHKTLEEDVILRNAQFEHTKKDLEAQLEKKAKELAGAHLAQIDWEKQQAVLNKELESQKSEVVQANAKVTQVEAQHLSTEAGLNQKINNLSAQVKELQNAETNAKKNAKKEYDEKLAAAKNKIHAEVEAAQMGHEYKHVFIQDIFHAGHKLDFSEGKDREIFDLIGKQWNAHPSLAVDHLFKEKKKLLVVVHRAKHGDQTPNILTTTDGALRFAKPLNGAE